ncbi:MAG: hypothetical protein ABIA04_08525 [Pseudomonadota bacterium]
MKAIKIILCLFLFFQVLASAVINTIDHYENLLDPDSTIEEKFAAIAAYDTVTDPELYEVSAIIDLAGRLDIYNPVEMELYKKCLLVLTDRTWIDKSKLITEYLSKSGKSGDLWRSALVLWALNENGFSLSRSAAKVASRILITTEAELLVFKDLVSGKASWYTLTGIAQRAGVWSLPESRQAVDVDEYELKAKLIAADFLYAWYFDEAFVIDALIQSLDSRFEAIQIASARALENKLKLKHPETVGAARIRIALEPKLAVPEFKKKVYAAEFSYLEADVYWRLAISLQGQRERVELGQDGARKRNLVRIARKEAPPLPEEFELTYKGIGQISYSTVNFNLLELSSIMAVYQREFPEHFRQTMDSLSESFVFLLEAATLYGDQVLKCEAVHLIETYLLDGKITVVLRVNPDVIEVQWEEKDILKRKIIEILKHFEDLDQTISLKAKLLRIPLETGEISLGQWMDLQTMREAKFRMTGFDLSSRDIHPILGARENVLSIIGSEDLPSVEMVTEQAPREADLKTEAALRLRQEAEQHERPERAEISLPDTERPSDVDISASTRDATRFVMPEQRSGEHPYDPAELARKRLERAKVRTAEEIGKAKPK